MNKKAVIKCSNHRQGISQLKPHILNPIKKFMQLSLQADASSDFSTWLQQDFHKSQEMWQKFTVQEFQLRHGKIDF